MESDEVYRDRARRLYFLLRDHPELHDQNVYVAPTNQNECGTVGCIAGWASLAQAGEVNIDSDGTPHFAPLHEVESYDNTGEWDTYCTIYDSLLAGNAHGEGAKWLGLSSYMADSLFLTMDREVVLEVLHDLATGELDRNTDHPNYYDDWEPEDIW